MNRDQVTRQDFPLEKPGYDRASVDAHLVAVDALIAAAEAEVAALKVERDALRRPAPAGDPPDVAPGNASLPRTESSPRATAETGAAEAPVAPEPASDSGGAPGAVPEAAPGRPAAGNDDEVSARLVATKLAMDGADREAIRERLESDYDLGDTDGLIDDLFERLG